MELDMTEMTPEEFFGMSGGVVIRGAAPARAAAALALRLVTLLVVVAGVAAGLAVPVDWLVAVLVTLLAALRVAAVAWRAVRRLPTPTRY